MFVHVQTAVAFGPAASGLGVFELNNIVTSRTTTYYPNKKTDTVLEKCLLINNLCQIYVQQPRNYFIDQSYTKQL